MKRITVRMITHLALIVALDIVLTRILAISTPVVRISFGFIPIAICGMLYGPLWAGLTAGISDVLGMLILNFSGFIFHPGITLNAALVGVVFGMFLYKKQGTYRYAAAAGVNSLIISLGVQTYWLAGLQGIPYWMVFTTRIPQAVVTLVLQLAVLPCLYRVVKMLDKKMMKSVA